MSKLAIDLIDHGLAERSATAIGRRFFHDLQSYGANAIFARAFWSIDMKDETVFSRISPPGWEQLYDHASFRQDNMITRAIRFRSGAYAWSSLPVENARDIALWRLLQDCGFPDGLAITAHAAQGYVGVTSLAFERLHAIDPAERAAIEMAGLVLHHRMRELTPPERINRPRLTPRERDCIGFVAQGLSDSEIAARTGVAATTVVSHIQNAKRKLGAKTRAQAVACCLLAGLL